LTELARVKLSDREFGELFYRSVTKDIGKADLLLEGFLKYLVVNTPLKKKDTIHRMIEEALEKYQVQLESKRIKLSKNFEKDLPETIVPDEPLRYILNSILQYGVNSLTPDGYLGFLTKSYLLKEAEDLSQTVLRKDGKYIEIQMFFTGYRKPKEPFEGSPIFHEEEPLDLILRLVKEVVRKNRGIMKFETDEEKGKTFILLRFPSERREIVHYQPIDQFYESK
jgi:hypothetical protein